MRIANEFWCDAEIGKPGHWHACKRKAKTAIVAASGCTIHYCERHAKRIGNPKYLVPDAGAKPQPIHR